MNNHPERRKELLRTASSKLPTTCLSCFLPPLTVTITKGQVFNDERKWGGCHTLILSIRQGRLSSRILKQSESKTTRKRVVLKSDTFPLFRYFSGEDNGKLRAHPLFRLQFDLALEGIPHQVMYNGESQPRATGGFSRCKKRLIDT